MKTLKMVHIKKEKTLKKKNTTIYLKSILNIEVLMNKMV